MKNRTSPQKCQEKQNKVCFFAAKITIFYYIKKREPMNKNQRIENG
jgi:hypothetical protein